jgi:hypothetical protein
MAGRRGRVGAKGVAPRNPSVYAGCEGVGAKGPRYFKLLIKKFKKAKRGL